MVTIHNHTSASGLCQPSDEEEEWTQARVVVWSLHEFWSRHSSSSEGYRYVCEAKSVDHKHVRSTMLSMDHKHFGSRRFCID